MSASQDKAAARQAAVARRKAAHGAGQGAATLHLSRALAPFGPVPLAGYLAIRTEIDPVSSMAAHPGPVAVPVIVAAHQPLQFRRWQPGVALMPGPLGVPVPEAGETLSPRVVIVPLLAFDRAGYRLGYGGGFYDRTLQALRQTGPVTAIGFAFAAQETDHVPRDATDQPLDLIVTEAGVIVPNQP